jgi:hypothetical protein
VITPSRPEDPLLTGTMAAATAHAELGTIDAPLDVERTPWLIRT